MAKEQLGEANRSARQESLYNFASAAMGLAPNEVHMGHVSRLTLTAFELFDVVGEHRNLPHTGQIRSPFQGGQIPDLGYRHVLDHAFRLGPV